MPRPLPDKAVIGMVHLPALPGTPGHTQSAADILDAAVRDAAVLLDGGVDGLLLENMHDRPYQRGAAAPEVIAVMTLAAARVRGMTGRCLGLQILAAANREALAVALAADLDFIRVEGFVFAHVADEGIIESCAADLLRYRRHIGAESVRIFADIKKKHSAHAITADLGVGETARAAEFFLADGVIVTGEATGRTANPDEVAEAKAATKLPVLVGSGITAQNIRPFLAHADGVIVGSALKENGDWTRPVSLERVRDVVAAARACQEGD